MERARYYQSLLDSGVAKTRAELARHLGVSRARVTQVLKSPEGKLICLHHWWCLQILPAQSGPTMPSLFDSVLRFGIEPVDIESLPNVR